MSTSQHLCPDCGETFTCTPAQPEPYVTPCRVDKCISYDPDNDPEIEMGFKEPVRKDH